MKRCDTDLKGLRQLAEEINEKLKIPVPSIDKDVLRHLADTCAGHFAPLCAAMGGVIGQEVIKAVTGKFTPINQWVGKVSRLVCHNSNIFLISQTSM